MSLKIYISPEQQAFKKEGANFIGFGVQISPTYKLIQIRDAYYSGSNTSATSVKLVKIQKWKPYNTIEETTLSNSVIKYEGGQFLIDFNVDLGVIMDNCLYYLEFTNGEETYKSEVFLAQAFKQQLSADQTFWTADSTLITADQTNITI